jgi:uncharacterized membrane protein
MTSSKGYGGVTIPGLHRHQNQTEETPPSDHIRETIRRDEAARLQQVKTVEAFGARVSRVEIVADRALDAVSRFDWKLNIILGGVGASLVTIVIMAAWTLTSLQKANTETRAIAAQEAKAVTIGVVDEERRHLRDEIRNERADAIRALLAEQRKQGTNPDLLTARATP